jgi:hypothetical protein
LPIDKDPAKMGAMEGSGSDWKQLRLRYAATCSTCGIALSPRADAFWNRELKQALCIVCGGDGTAGTPSGMAGASALRRAEDLKSHAVNRAREQWGDHAAKVAEKIAVNGTWVKGGEGERRLADFIEREVGDAVIPVHDRVIPGAGKANIDLIWVAPTGVWIVDAKTYKGQVEKRDIGPFWREELQVYVGGRNRSKLADGLTLQLSAVRAALEDDPIARETYLHPTLCFVDSDWSLFARPFSVRGVTVLYPAALRDRLKKHGNLSRESMERIARRLGVSLPPASPK